MRGNAMLLLCIALAFFLSACARQKNLPVIDADADDQAMRYGTQWALIVDSFAVFRNEPDVRAEAQGFGRKGDIEKVTGRAIKQEQKNVIWYGFEKGWLPETSVVIFSNQLKALKVSQSMMSSESPAE